jgi:hypothetical protein
MAELVKPWNDGGSLSVAYEGDGDGSAVFSSDVNEGIDREMHVYFKDVSGNVSVERSVRQEGRREVFGDIVFADGGTFNVIKLIKPYTELEYIESTGTQYLNLGVTFKNTDECYLDGVLLSHASDKFMLAPSKWNNNNNRFGMFGGYGSTFGYAYGAKVTNGCFYSPSFAKDTNRHIFSYIDKTFRIEDLGATADVSSITWGGDTSELRLFYGYSSITSGRVYSYKQKRDGVLLIDLIPVLDLNNTPCMYDKVSGTFFYNQGTGDFIAGYKTE